MISKILLALLAFCGLLAVVTPAQAVTTYDVVNADDRFSVSTYLTNRLYKDIPAGGNSGTADVASISVAYNTTVVYTRTNMCTGNSYPGTARGRDFPSIVLGSCDKIRVRDIYIS